MLVHETLIAFVAKTARGVYGKYGASDHETLIAFVAKTARGVYGKYGASDIHEEVRWV